jgi:hypothetical protein
MHLQAGSQTDDEVCLAGGSSCLLPLVRRLEAALLPKMHNAVVQVSPALVARTSRLVSTFRSTLGHVEQSQVLFLGFTVSANL